MLLIECVFCNLKFKKNDLLHHLFNYHNDINYDLKKDFYSKSIIEFESKHENATDNQLRKINDSNKKVVFNKLKSHVKSTRFYQEKKELIFKIEKINNSFYKELALNEYLSLREYLVDKISNFSDFNLLDLAINLRLELYESILNKLENSFNSLPDKNDFIKNSCQSIYVSWDDIEFVKDFIKIKSDKVIIQPIPIEGSLKILNELKKDYFKKEYKREIYKLVIYKGICFENLTKSKGLIEIKEIISKHISNVENLKIINNDIIRNETIRYFNKETIISYLNKIKNKNDFLGLPIKLMEINDHVISIIENNNGVYEECLVYFFKRNKKIFVLWENSNPNRAGYIFEYNEFQFKTNEKYLLEFISSHISYKRESLFRNYDIKDKFNLNYSKHYLIKHELINEYLNSLANIINHDI